MSFIEGTDRGQVSQLPPCLDDHVAHDALVRVVDAFVASLDLTELGFGRTVAASTGRPGYRPGDMLKAFEKSIAAVVATCAETCVGGPGRDCVIPDGLSVGCPAGARSCCGAAGETARA